jgi:UDP-N-acetyl-D-glucosamine 4,6-dehydratase
VKRLLQPSNLKRQLFFIISDITIILLSMFLAFAFRFDFEIESQYFSGLCMTIVFLVIVRIIGLYFLKIYAISWRHFSIADLLRLIYVLIASSVALVFFIRSEERRVGKECRRLCRSRWSPYH